MLVPAIETAFCKASFVTLDGSTIPQAFRSTNFLAGWFTSTPKPGFAALTCGNHSSALIPALVSKIRNGCSSAFLSICLPAVTDSSSVAVAEIALIRLISVTPPPGTIPSSSAALTAATASSTRNFFSSISVSVAPPTFITATLPLSEARLLSRFSLSYSLVALTI